MNIFNGDSYYTQFAQVAYRRLMSREWVAYEDIMADYLGLNSPEDLPCSISNCDNYGELKKAFRDIRKYINEKHCQNSFEEEGNNRNKRFRYIGPDNDPLADMRNAKVISDLRQYWQFCQDSAGFFPASWLEYFFKDSKDLLDIKTKRKEGDQVLSASVDRDLTNIELLPFLYEAIVHRQVLSIAYRPYGKQERTLIFHPQFLKEFNGRWHLFGHAEGQDPEFGYHIAIDRICSRPHELYDKEYMSAPQGFYEKYFRDIVGFSRSMTGKAKHVYIRAHTRYMFNLTETKKIHESQTVSIPFGEHDDGIYGEFALSVEVNNEFIGRILQMGDGLEVVAPKEVRDVFKKRISNMAKRYGVT